MKKVHQKYLKKTGMSMCYGLMNRCLGVFLRRLDKVVSL